jgi:hypothetical protein
VRGYVVYEAEDPYCARHYREDAKFLLRNLKDCSKV